MAVTGYCESSLAATGEKRSATGGGSYTANYRVQTNNAADGPVAIINFMVAQGFALGSPFSFGNDTDALSFATAIRPTRQFGSTTEWNCQITYEPTDPQTTEEDEDNNPTEDPLAWKWEVSVAVGSYQVDAWGGYNVRGIDHIDRAAGSWGPIVNSADTPFDPPPQVAESETILRISGNVNGLQLTDSDVVNHINEFDLEFSDTMVNKYDLSQSLFKKYTLKCTAFEAIYRRANNVNFYSLQYEWRWRKIDDPFPTPVGKRLTYTGWLEQNLDQGFDRTWFEGDPDGQGSTVSASDIAPAGKPDRVPILDREGKRIVEPYNLNGKGQPAKKGNPDADPVDWFVEGYWHLWRLNEYANFVADTVLDVFKYPTP